MEFKDAQELPDIVDQGMTEEKAQVTDVDLIIRGYIRVYKDVKGKIKILEAEANFEKGSLIALMQEHGLLEVKTEVGSAQFTADGERVTYNADALDALCASSEAVAKMLMPHRKATVVKGGLTIK